MDKRTERNRKCRRRLFRGKKIKLKKGRRCKRKGKNQTISVTCLSPPTLRSFKRDLEIKRKKNDSQILLFQPLSHGRKLLIL